MSPAGLWAAALSLFLALVGLAAFAAPEGGAPPLPPDGRVADAQALLRHLSSDDWKQRQQAEEDLVRGGDAAGVMIRRWLDDAPRESGAALDAETRSRLEAALRRIEDNRVAGPSFVTLHVKEAAPGAVAAALFRQAGAEPRTSPDDLWEQGRWPSVSLDLDRQPFWAALKQFAAQAGAGVAASDDGLYFLRGGGVAANGPWVVSGPFLVAATEVSRNQRLVPAAGADGQPAGEASRSDEFAVQFVLLAEPKLNVLRPPEAIRFEEVVDDAGNALHPPAASRTGDSMSGGRGVWTYRAKLNYPSAPGKRIARLRGAAAFLVQTASEQIEVPDVARAKDVERKLKDVRVVVGGLKRLADRPEYELRVVMYFGGAADGVGAGVAPADLGRGRWARVQRGLYEMQTRLRLVDAEGQALERRGFGSRVNGDEVEITARFGPSLRARDRRRSGDPEKLVWQVPTASKEVPVTFEFRDLPMP